MKNWRKPRHIITKGSLVLANIPLESFISYREALGRSQNRGGPSGGDGRLISGEGEAHRRRGRGGGGRGDRATPVGTRNWGRDGLWRRAHGGAEAAAN